MRALVVVDQHALGDFKFEHGRVDAGVGDGRLDRLDEIALAKLDGADIDADAGAAEFGTDAQACLAQYPLADRDDLAILLGDRNEIRRADQPLFRMPPADQRLVGHDPAGGDGDARLEMQVELATLQGFRQIRLDLAALLQLRIHAGLVEAVGVPAHVLGVIERGVGARDEPFQLSALVFRHGHADAGADPDLCPVLQNNRQDEG